MREIVTHQLFLFIPIIFLLCWPGCNSDHAHSHGEGEHTHEHTGKGNHDHSGQEGQAQATHGNHDHSGHGQSGEDDGPPAQSVTVWGEKTELFMEYEPLVVGRESRFAAHLTTISDFKAVTDGVLTLKIRSKDGTSLDARANSPASPGIFRFTMKPTHPGPCHLSLHYHGQGIEETIDGGECVFFESTSAALAGLPQETESGKISYTKEAQWKTEFASAPVQKRALQPSVRAAGEIRPVSGGEAAITAPARGRISIPANSPLPGTRIHKGQILATLSPYLQSGNDRASLEAEVQTAEAELSALRSQLSRLERLLEKQAVPERRVEEARSQVNVAEARLKGAKGRLGQYNQGATGSTGRGSGLFKLRSPIEGTLVSIQTANGESVEEGQLLFKVVDLTRLWLAAQVFEPDIPKVTKARSAWFTIEGYDKPFTVDGTNGRLVDVGKVLDPTRRTVPVIFEMRNPDEKLRIGQFAEVHISSGEPREVLALPSSALLDEGGKQVVYVQTAGETFERRVIKTGIRAEGWVEITGGAVEMERVVTKGAYEVRLAAASGAIPQHGHVH